MTLRAPVSFCSLGVQIVAAGLISLYAAVPARAADASRWDANPHSSVRLIAADAPTQSGASPLRAGVEIKLATGWKTYWRYPGDSGVPPRFDFARSENVKSVTVEWPAPHRFADDSGVSIGYKGEVIFPLTVVPQDTAKPVVLRLDLDYAICEKLCMPATAKAELVLTGVATVHKTALSAAQARVPVHSAVGEPASLAIRSVRRDVDAAEQRIVVDVTVPAGATSVELFAEGPAPDWALPVPEPVEGAPAGQKRFAFTLTGLPPGASADGAALRFTAVAGDRAIEVVFRLD